VRRLVIGTLVLGLAVTGVLVYMAAHRDREYVRLIAAADAALAVDQPLVAIEALSGAIALKQDSMLAWLKRGDIYRRRREWSSAIRDLRTAAQLDPTSTRVLERLGDVQAGMQRHDRAAELYGQYVRLDDRSPRVLYKLGLAHYRAGRITAALQPLRQAVALDDRFAEGHYLLGLCLREQRMTGQARSAWTRAVEIAPGFVAAREQLAGLDRIGSNQRALLDQLEALAALEPDRPERRLALALAQAEARRTDLAAATLTAALEHFPDQTDLSIALGRVWLQAAEAGPDPVALDRAVDTLDRLPASARSTSEALTLLGRALLLQGKTRRAEQVLVQATERFPVEPGAFEALAEAARRLGHEEVGAEAIRRHQILTGTVVRTSLPLR
jgi:tetratricopeptide (TPR) repeat protein